MKFEIASRKVGATSFHEKLNIMHALMQEISITNFWTISLELDHIIR